MTDIHSAADHLLRLHALADTCPFDFTGAMAQSVDGFLGTGGDLSVPTLLHAYRSGVFPWFNHDDPICWWSPDVRCVLMPDQFTPSKSLVRTAKKQSWTLTTNLAFDAVIDACSQPRSYTDETWIGDTMKSAYADLHTLGVAVSVEIWEGVPLDSELIGGLYGVNIGAIFCGESMFHRHTDASKIAFWGLMHLCQQAGITLVDCQLENPHLMSLGAQLLPRAEFLDRLKALTQARVQGLGDEKFFLPVGDLIHRR